MAQKKSLRLQMETHLACKEPKEYSIVLRAPRRLSEKQGLKIKRKQQ